MKTRLALWCGCASLVVVLALWQMGGASPAVAGDDHVTASAATLISTVVTGGDAEYVGSKKCKKCHLKQHKSWESTKHAAALAVLKPGERSEAKSKSKLDPGKDYTTDAGCLACHVTGFGKPGGYAVPADEEAAKKAEDFAGAGCEMCHGAGGGFMALHEEIKKSKRMYKDEEMYAAGVVKIEAAVCTKCHNDKSPTYDASKPFEFEKAKKAEGGTHENIPLTQREG